MMDRGCANAVMSDRAAGGWAWENLGADVAQDFVATRTKKGGLISRSTTVRQRIR
jgi:hypothetical protein